MRALRIAITGNIGSGKSYVCALFKTLGIPVFDSDLEAKRLYYREDIQSRIVARIGAEAYLEDGQLNRPYLASVLFSDPEALSFVEQTLYPALNACFAEWADRQTSPYVLYESALIFEKGLKSLFDAVIVVTASESTRIRRVMARDHSTEERVRSRMALQISEAEKISGADYLVFHDQDEEDAFLMEQVLAIHHSLVSGDIGRSESQEA